MNSRTQFLGLHFAACALGLATARPASAEEPFAGQVPSPPSEAPDDLSGHLTLAPHIQWVVPTGSAENGYTQRGYTGSGPGFGLDASFGVSKYVALQARFDWASFQEGNDCPPAGACSAQTTAVGLGVEYHLVNGAAFDPWLGAGLAWRWTSFDLSWPNYQPGSLDFSGLDWLHLAVGGEWYPHRLLGFGPFLAFDLGSYSNRPAASVPRPSAALDESAIHSFFSIGIRGVFAPMR